MTSLAWWLVHLLLYLLGLWSGSALTWLVTEYAGGARMSARHRLWRAVTWLPWFVYGFLDWRRA